MDGAAPAPGQPAPAPGQPAPAGQPARTPPGGHAHRGGGGRDARRGRVRRRGVRELGQGRRHIPAGQQLQHRLAQSVRRIPGRRLCHVRVHLSHAGPVQPPAPVRAGLRAQLDRELRREGLDLPHPAGRQVVRRQAADRGRRGLDLLDHPQVPGRADGQLRGLCRAHEERHRAERDHPGADLQAAGGQRAVAGAAGADPARACLGQVRHRQRQGADPVPEQRADRVRRPVHPDQVHAQADRAVQAQPDLLRPQAAHRRPRAAVLPDHRRDDHRAEEQSAGRGGDRDTHLGGHAQGRPLRGAVQPGRRIRRLHHQRQPAAGSQPPGAGEPAGAAGVRRCDRPAGHRAHVAARPRQAWVIDHPARHRPLERPGDQTDRVQPGQGQPAAGPGRVQDGAGRGADGQRPPDVVSGDHADRHPEPLRPAVVPDHPGRLQEDRRPAEPQGAGRLGRVQRDHRPTATRTSRSRCGTGTRSPTRTSCCPC